MNNTSDQTEISLGICDFDNENQAKKAAELFTFAQFSYSMVKPADNIMARRDKTGKDINKYVCVLVFVGKLFKGDAT